jgi:thiol-disulfide isomerase/thioredoxin
VSVWRHAAAALLLLAAGCGPDTVSRDWERVDPPSPAPQFSLPTLAGGEESLAANRGRVVVMEFWATWCGPCRSSLPSLEVIYKKYRDRGVNVLLINEGEGAEAAAEWLGKRYTAPVLLDQDGTVGQQYGVRGIPRLFVIDQEGRLVYAHGGYGGGLEQNLKLILDGLLAPPAPAQGT